MRLTATLWAAPNKAPEVGARKGGVVMSGNACGFAVATVLSIGVALLVYALVRRGLHILLDETIRIPAGTSFYARLFLIGLVFLALYSVLSKPFRLAGDAAFMEYVWQIADEVSSTLVSSCIFIGVYLVLITIIVAALRRRND